MPYRIWNLWYAYITYAQIKAFSTIEFATGPKSGVRYNLTRNLTTFVPSFPKYLNLTENLRMPIFMALLFRGKITDFSIEA